MSSKQQQQLSFYTNMENLVINEYQWPRQLGWVTLGEDWAGQLLVITAVTATVRIILVASIFETLTSGKILAFLILQLIILTRASWWLSGKEFTCQCRRHEFNPWVRMVSWRRKWKSTPVILSGKSHGQWRMGRYSP